VITISDIPEGIYRDWLLRAADFLETNWGLNRVFGLKMALLILYSHFAGNEAILVSGFRSPDRQKALQKQWDSGNRSGLVARPATNSLHSVVTFGKPDAHALDISFSNKDLAGSYAPVFGLKWGGNFKSVDKPHFYVK